MVIREKRPQDEVPNFLPSKKGKIVTDSKGKETMPPLKAKKQAAKSSKAKSRGATPAMAIGEGTSANPGDVLGLNASMMESSTVAEKLLEGVIPSFDKEETGKLDHDRAISRLFSEIGQVITYPLVKVGLMYF